jgi:hypothetical protein
MGIPSRARTTSTARASTRSISTRPACSRRRRADHDAHRRQAHRRAPRPARDLHAEAARDAGRQRPPRLFHAAAAPTKGADGADELDEDTLFAIGGLLAHAPAFTAICNPTVNSYKRLVAAWDAPIYTCGRTAAPTRSCAFRAPDERRRRIEVRSADPSCNPYLAMAVLVASLADGVRTHALPAIR